LAYASFDSTIYIVDLEQQKLLQSIKLEKTKVAFLHFLPNGDNLAICLSDPIEIIIYDIKNKKIKNKINSKYYTLDNIWFSNDGKLMHLNSSNIIQDWNWADSVLVQTHILDLKGKASRFSANNKIVVTHTDENEFELFDYGKNKLIAKIPKPNEYAKFGFSPDDSIFYIDYCVKDVSLIRYHISTGKTDTILIDKIGEGPQPYRVSWSFAPFSHFLINLESMRIWDIDKRKEIPNMGKHSLPLTERLSVETCFAPNGKRMYSIIDPFSRGTTEAIAWNAVTQQPEFSMRGPECSNKLIRLSPNAKYLAAIPYRTGEDSIRIWDIDKRKTIFTLSYQFYSDLAFSPDSKSIYLCDDVSKIICYDIQSGKKVVLPNEQMPVRVSCLMFSTDNNYLLTASSFGVLTLLEYPSLHRVSEIKTDIQGREYVTTAISFDGKLIATLIRGNEVKIWAGMNGNLIHSSKKISAGYYTCLTFSPDGKFLYLGGTDETVHVINVTTGRFEYCIPQGFYVSHIEFIRDKPHIMAVTGVGQVRFWDTLK
jgi:WD40 repeat protein